MRLEELRRGVPGESMGPVALPSWEPAPLGQEVGEDVRCSDGVQDRLGGAPESALKRRSEAGAILEQISGHEQPDLAAQTAQARCSALSCPGKQQKAVGEGGRHGGSMPTPLPVILPINQSRHIFSTDGTAGSP